MSQYETFRLPDITGQSLPVLTASRMMDVLWSDLHTNRGLRTLARCDPNAFEVRCRPKAARHETG